MVLFPRTRRRLHKQLKAERDAFFKALAEGEHISSDIAHEYLYWQIYSLGERLKKKYEETGESEPLPSYDEVDSELPEWSQYDPAEGELNHQIKCEILGEQMERFYLHARRRRALIVQMQDSTRHQLKWKILSHYRQSGKCWIGDSKSFNQKLANAQSGHDCEHHPGSSCYCVRWELDCYPYYWNLLPDLSTLLAKAGLSQCPEYTVSAEWVQMGLSGWILERGSTTPHQDCFVLVHRYRRGAHLVG